MDAILLPVYWNMKKITVLTINTLIDAQDGIARLDISVEGLGMLSRLFSRIQQLPNIIAVCRLRGGYKLAGRKRKPE